MRDPRFNLRICHLVACFGLAAASVPAQAQGPESRSAMNSPPKRIEDSKESAKAPTGNAPSRSAPANSDYVIGRDDLLAIHVWHEPEISGTIPVRPDGKISLPLIGDLEASGLTPVQLQAAITEKLRAYLSDPEVAVIVQQFNSQRFNILGEVQRPGSYPFATRMRVLDAIALAGGFRDFAKVKKIYVLRPTPGGGSTKIPFNYKKVIRGKDANQNVELKPGDTIVVP